jgi:hypothetical protein
MTKKKPLKDLLARITLSFKRISFRFGIRTERIFIGPHNRRLLNVIDKGSYKPNLGDEIYIRYKDVRYISGNDTTVNDGNYFSLYGPVELIYGNLNTYQSIRMGRPHPKCGS